MPAATPMLPATRLTAEHLLDPVGLGVPTPRLSWWLPTGSVRQVAYRVEVNGAAGEWVESDQSVLVHWPVTALVSRQRADWRVQVRTDLGEHPWSEASTVEAGLLDHGDWTAQWIEPHEPQVAPPGERPAYLLRREFRLAAVGAARLYASAHGVYEVFLNGERVGDHELTPGNTSARTRVMAQAYDVTDLLREGANTWEVLLSDGFYRGKSGFDQDVNCYGDTLAFLGQLHVGEQAVITDGSWSAGVSQVVQADPMAGQSTDFRLVPTLAPVRVVDHGYGALGWSPAPPIRRVEEIRPVSVTRLTLGTGVGGHQVVDLGQNINGWVRLSRLGPAGTTIRLVHGEHLAADGDVTRDHLDVQSHSGEGALSVGMVDRVVSSGRPGEVFEPRHTFHGFRYVRVEGCPFDLTPDDVTGVVVHTDFVRTGWFRCRDERLNWLHEATVWSFRDNACDVPTDCPQRERVGWTGDYQIFAKAASFLYDVAGFSRKWLDEVIAEQEPNGMIVNLAPDPIRRKREADPNSMNRFLQGSSGWGDAIAIVPWQMWNAYADPRFLADCLPAMEKWVEYAAAAARGGRHPQRVERSAEPLPHEQYLWDTGFHWGEWHEPGFDAMSMEYWQQDRAPVATAFLYWSAHLTALAADVLGRADVAARHAELAEHVRDAWQREFIAADGALIPDTQANHVRALAFGLVPDELRAQTAARLAQLVRDNDNHLATGFLSTGDLLPQLADAGYANVAYDLLLQDTPPSWLAMRERGATTMWENWEGVRADGTAVDSLNHYSKGAVITFLHRYVAGICPIDGEPGYRRFRIEPLPGGGLTFAEATLDCPYGRIRSAWRIDEGRFTLDVEVPPGTEAEVVLPDGSRSTVVPGSWSSWCSC